MLRTKSSLARARGCASNRCGRELRRRFRSDEDGNIAILFTFMFGVLMLFSGAAVDFTRYNSVRADMIEALDAAGLAMVQIDDLNSGDIAGKTGADRDAHLIVEGRKFFHENFKHESRVQDLVINFDITPADITPSASGKIKTLLLNVGQILHNRMSGETDRGLEYLNLSASTQITRHGAGRVEVALVLDVTGSMSDKISGERKIESLRKATASLMDQLYRGAEVNEFARVAVVPFNAYVNPGKTVGIGDDSIDENAQAFYHGAHFLHVDENGVPKPGIKVNHKNLFNSNANLTWKGCVLERPYPLDEMDTAPGDATDSAVLNAVDDAPTGETDSRVLQAFNNAPDLTLSTAVVGAIENSRWIPMFNPDSPNCNQSGGGASDDACVHGDSGTRSGIAYNGSWFDDPDEDMDGASAKTSGWPSYPGDSIDNIVEADYRNSFVDDKRYTRFTDANLDRYLKVVNYWRKVMNGYDGACTYSGANVTDNAFKNWFIARGGSECLQDEYILRDAYVGHWNPGANTYSGKYNLTVSIDESVTEGTDEYTQGPNRDCPAPILPLTTTKKDVIDYVNALAPNGNTNSAAGAMWGWRVISPGAPFEDNQPYDSLTWLKAVVIMTDGNNTVSALETHWGSDLTTYGYAREKRMGATIDTASEMRDELDDKLLRICSRMKEREILVYTIVFGLDMTKADDIKTAEVFDACATPDDDGEQKYFFNVSNGADLETAFNDIGADLVSTHVSN